jgi:hypothetical protein
MYQLARSIRPICSIDGSTGTHSYYKSWNGFEIMFQVAPMMTTNPRRNAIIGNTVLTIVFLQDGAFDPSELLSQVLRMSVSR